MSSDTPLVSIITPILETDLNYVKECIRSVANQTYPKDRIEMMICEDSRDPEYQKKLEDLTHKAQQISIELIFNNEYLGLSKSRNKAVNYSKGDWLLILDSDDLLEKKAIENLIHIIDSSTAMVYGDHVRISCDLKKTKYVRKKSLYHSLLKKFADNFIYNPLYSSVYISHGVLIRKDVFLEVGGYKKEIGETPPVLIGIFEKTGIESIKHVSEIVYYHRENRNGIANQREFELIKSHEQTFLSCARRHSESVSNVKYIGRVKPFMAKHFAFYNQEGDIIRLPYVDYTSLTLI